MIICKILDKRIDVQTLSDVRIVLNLSDQC